MFLIDIFKATVILFLEMAPYLMLGLFFVGLLNIFFTKDLITRHVGKNNFLSVFKAALFGVPLPLCSCGVVPTAVYMAKNGASKPAVLAFLIATPQSGIDSILATYGMLGPVFAIFRPIAALFMGIFGGLAAHLPFLRVNEASIEKPLIETEEYKVTDNPKKNLRFYLDKGLIYPFVEFLDDITSQFIAGLLIAGLITYIIPENFFTNSFISTGIVGMLLLVLVGIPMYVCATASIPIAVSLIMKGFSPGVAFVFLAAGPATNAASIVVLSKVLGKKTTVVFIAVITVFSILFGLILDWIFVVGGFDIHAQMSHAHNHGMANYNWFDISISIVFLILILMSIYRKFIKPKLFKEEIDMTDSKIKVNIEGMTCNHCAMNVRKAISGTEGVTSVDINLPENVAYVEGDFNMDNLKKAVEDMGYKVV